MVNEEISGVKLYYKIKRSLPMKPIQTQRLDLQEVNINDTAFIIELLNSPGWLAYIGDAKVREPNDAARYIETKLQKGYRDDGFGLYKMVLRSTGETIGLCGLIQRSFLEDIDLGFGLLPQYYRKGYTYEASIKMLEYAFYELKVNKVLAFTSLENPNSQNLLKKLGFKTDGIIKYGNTEEDVHLYKLEMEKFLEIQSGQVKAVSKSSTHSFSKFVTAKIKLLKGLGIEGDAHMGKTVKHRSRVRKDPNQPNLRQVHLIHEELFNELAQKGFTIKAGQMGENILTHGIDLLNLPRNTILKIGNQAEIEITGLRNPCSQLNGLQEGLMQALVFTDDAGKVIRKAGIMGIVKQGGEVRVGDRIEVIRPIGEHVALERV